MLANLWRRLKTLVHRAPPSRQASIDDLFDMEFGKGNWHRVPAGEPYAKLGDIVTCEHGHKICLVVRAIKVGDLFDGGDAFRFAYIQDRPEIGSMPEKCVQCGSCWWVSGNLFHFDDGWRVG